MHVSNSDRIFLTDTDSHADVTREGFLGITNSVMMACDDGTMRAYCGNDLKSNVVNTSTGLNGDGSAVVIPMDVKTDGPAILTQFGLDPLDQVALFQKFMVLPKALRRQKMTEWQANISDETTRATFLTEFVDLLGDDDLFIKTQADKLLRHIDETIRGEMLVKFYQLTDAETRRNLIVQFTVSKNDKFKTEEFLQSIYAMTMTSDQYLRMELILAVGNLLDRGTERVDAFMAARSEASRGFVAATWKKRKYYRGTTGPRYAVRLLKRY